VRKNNLAVLFCRCLPSTECYGTWRRRRSSRRSRLQYRRPQSPCTTSCES